MSCTTVPEAASTVGGRVVARHRTTAVVDQSPGGDVTRAATATVRLDGSFATQGHPAVSDPSSSTYVARTVTGVTFATDAARFCVSGYSHSRAAA